jgi:hypothetical protein
MGSYWRRVGSGNEPAQARRVAAGNLAGEHLRMGERLVVKSVKVRGANNAH